MTPATFKTQKSNADKSDFKFLTKSIQISNL